MEAAFAGALGVRLGGRNNYGDRAEDRPVLGDGPLPTPDDVDRAVRLSLLIGAATAAVIALARRQLPDEWLSNAGRPRVRRAAQRATMMAGAANGQDQEQRG